MTEKQNLIMPQMSIRVDKDLDEWYQKEAKRLGVSKSQVMKKALIQYQVRKEKKK